MWVLRNIGGPCINAAVHRTHVQAIRDGPSRAHCRWALARAWVEDDVAYGGHGTCQFTIDLVQEVRGWPAEEDGAALISERF